MTVRLFARVRELAGAGEVVTEVPHGATARAVWDSLVAQYPALADHTRVISVAINEEYARMDAVLREGDEVAFLPPVSGG